MPGIDYSQPILGAGASAQTEFAAAQARTGLDFRGAAQLKRGFKVELGVGAFADASGELSKFVRASIAGTAFARAQAGIQLQLPLNLFKEFGFAARAEAIAEAAAGLRADLALSIGDFILLAQREEDLIGLPLELLLLFLEEVSIGGNFEINVAASAKAHASLTVTGCVIEKPGQKAGFFYTVDAGVGLAAGMGMGLQAGAEFKDFRRFFGRATDRALDSTVRTIGASLPDSAKDALLVFKAFAPVAKIAFRIAYDIGQKILQNNPGASAQQGNTLCNEAVKTLLEECQRFLLQKMLDGAIDTIHQRLAQRATTIGVAVWDGAMPERSTVASRLLALPDDPFQPTDGNIDYWRNLVSSFADLYGKVYSGATDASAVESLSILYAASELLIEAIRSKVNTASAYAMAIGAGTVDADTKPFDGALAVQPIALIKSAINSELGAAANRNLSYADLIQFLVRDLAVDRLLATVPEVREFMRIFAGDFARAENELLKVFLQNAGSFVPSAGGGGQMDPHETLRLIVLSLDRFITDKVRAEALPAILNNVPDATTRLYVEEVLFEAVVYVKDVALQSLLNWESKTFDNDDFTEALAGVMMLLLGRTVVVVADTFLTAVQEQISESCEDLSGKVRTGEIDLATLNLPRDPDFVRLVSDCIQIGGQVLGPLPRETRSRVRHLLYQVFEPIPPGLEQDFLEELSDQFFIPNEEDLRTLTDELAEISKDRFMLFAEKFLLRVGDYILEQLEEFLLQLVDLVLHWEEHLAEALNDLAALLRNLEDEVIRLNAQVIGVFRLADAALREFFDVLSGGSLRSKIKSAMKSLFVDKALGVLEDIDLYKDLPSGVRRGVRRALRSTINGLVSNPIVDPVIGAVREIAGAMDDLLLDCRELDPEENLPEQVLLLVLDKIEDNIRSHFGGTKPHLNVSVDFSFRDFFGNRHSIHIPLGRIEVNLNPFLDAVRDTIKAMDFYHSALNGACFKLAAAFAKELEVVAAELRKKEKEEEKRRLDKMSAEHNNGAREIAVLNPLPLSHHSKAVDVKIHLGGVPESFLGLARDEVQRVIICMNGNLIPVKSLIVDEASGVFDLRNNVADIDLRNSKGFAGETGVFKSGLAQIVMNTGRIVPQQVATTRKRSEATRYAFSTSEYLEQPVSKTAVSPLGKSDAHAPILGTDAKDDAKGRRVTSYEMRNIIPGRGNPASHINRILEQSLAGMLIQFRVKLEDLVEGANVLTVVVVERGGHRHQQNVTFSVTAPSINPPVKPGPGARPGLGGFTLRPLSPDPPEKTPPRKAHTIELGGRRGSVDGDKSANLLLPAASGSLRTSNQLALQYLQDQDRLNFKKADGAL